MKYDKQKPRGSGEATANNFYSYSNKNKNHKQLNFAAINAAALAFLPSLLCRWLPGGITQGNEYKALNPTRHDSKIGSFSVNLTTGKWADFATGDKGGDVISLAAYLADLSNYSAAIHLMAALGVDHEGNV